MTSLRHNDPPGFTPDDALLDAARECILAVGWRRTTLTEVARRAGVSRMTLYRRWPDMQTLLADLMTREWAVWPLPAGDGSPLDRIASGVTATVTALRGNALFAQDPATSTPSCCCPTCSTGAAARQDALLAVLVEAVAAGQRDGAVREGDPALLARSVLLAPYGFALSVPTMADDDVTVAGLDEELRLLVERYLAPVSLSEESGRLDAVRRERELAEATDGREVDLLVVGLGVTGAGVAARRRLARAVGGRGRRARPRVRHVAVELQAGARRAALPRHGPGRGGPRERRGARPADDPHRPAPDPGAADA